MTKTPRPFLLLVIIALGLVSVGGLLSSPKRGIKNSIRSLQKAVVAEDLATVDDLLLPQAKKRWWIAGLKDALARRGEMSEIQRELINRMYAEYQRMVEAIEVLEVTGDEQEAIATLRMPIIAGGYRLVLDFPTTWRQEDGVWRLAQTNWTSKQWMNAQLEKSRETSGSESHAGYPPFHLHRLPMADPETPPRIPRARFRCPRDMVPVPAGPSWMRFSGQRYAFSGKTDHQTDLPDFCIDRYEASRPDATSTSPDKGHFKAATSRKGVLPWVLITWPQAKAACEKVGKRLCSGAEWQKAAGGPAGLLYPNGNTFDPSICNTYDPNTGPRTLAPTGTFRKCRSPYGAYDMCGNVSEWTDELWQEGMDDRVLRGGSFNENPINGQGLYPFFGWRFVGYGEDVSAIHNHPAGDAHEDDGFRCCLTPEP